MIRRGLPCLALTFALLLTASQSRAAARQAATPAPLFAAGDLDLPAMIVTTADLEAIGLPGLGRFGNGFFVSFDRAVEIDARSLGLTEDEVRDWYARIGFGRVYATDFGLPSVPGDDQSPPTRGAFSRIQELGDAAGAAEYLARIKTALPEPGWEITVVEASFALDGGTAIVNDVYRDPGSGEQFHNSYVVFQSGNLFVATGFFRSVAEPATPAATPVAGETQAPTAATFQELEALARRQREQIEAVRAAGGPDLPNLALRVGDDPSAAAAHYSEGYRLLDGELIPYYGGFEDDILADPAATAGAVAAYELEEAFRYGDEPAPGDPYFLNRLYLFPDEATASAFVAGRPAALATGGFKLVPGATPASGSELLPGVLTDLGDESLAFAFVRDFGEEPETGYEIYARVGNVVAAVSLSGPAGLAIDATAAIAAAQAACLEAGACPDALPVPAALRTMPAATPIAATPAA